jgi:Ca2+-binding EF-hand superfamily protein
MQALDKDRKGYITKDELVQIMTSQGEPLQDLEMLEMLKAFEHTGCLEADTGYIRYGKYASVLAESSSMKPGATGN